MTEHESRSLDLLGIKGISDSVRVAVQGTIDGAAAFLSRVCLPAAEEFGLALRDRISAWRARNAARVLDRANQIHGANGQPAGQVSPRLVHLAIDEGSWTDHEGLSDMWAGLLASAVSPEPPSDENLIFMNILRQLSSLQVSILNYSIAHADKFSSLHGLPWCSPVVVSIEELKGLFSVDINRLDRELDHLREVGLIGGFLGGGIAIDSGETDLTPTALALHLYVRAQGSRLSPAAYWSLQARDPGPDGYSAA